jgi:predicted helicase
VVSFIVRSVDALLKAKFGLPQGLADTRTIKTQSRRDAETQSKALPKVLILDPATGTGTFLYSVIAHIRAQFMQEGNAGMWSGFVREHLLPRIFGFELLMAPYAVAHFKLSFQLAGHDLPEAQRALWAYDFASDERIQVYLTNALEAVEEEVMGLWGPLRIVTEEAQAANKVKQDYPIMVVLGNPPYSGHSANKSQWIDDLLHGKLPDGSTGPSYYEVDGHPLDERNPKWLQDDYVKFIRFGQWRIEQSDGGVLAYISNNGYLDNPTFRGMRQSLMETFSEIYILNLHGNARKREVSPDGMPDENVFDIMQGVAIGLFVKRPGNSEAAEVHYADLWGKREVKYRWLNAEEITTTVWEIVEPQSPFYLFLPQDTDNLAVYEKGWAVTDIFPANVLGFQTHRDDFAIAFSRQEMQNRIDALRNQNLSDEDLVRRYDVQDTADWSLADVRASVQETSDALGPLVPCAYRPFDWRYCYYGDVLMDRPRTLLMSSVVGKENLCLNTVRQTKAMAWRHALVADAPTPAVFLEIKDGSSVFPLYLYPNHYVHPLFDAEVNGWAPDPAHGNRVPNLAPAFVAAMEEKLGLTFDPFCHSDDVSCHSERSEESRSFGLKRKRPQDDRSFGPRDVFAYIYAIFHSPTYRERYAEFLKIDFPRVPLTSDADLFWQLVGLGGALIALHLLDLSGLERPDRSGVSFPIPGDNRVKRRGGFPTFIPAGESRTKTSDVAERNLVYINLTQYFAGVPEEVWAFEVGGYQVLHKWLKDRKGRVLSYGELAHYQQIVIALQETLRVMDAVDAAVGGWPIS